MSIVGSQSRNPVRDIIHPYKGVTFYKRTGRWEANIWYMGTQHSLGASLTALEAARAYDKGILLTRTDLGQLNFDQSDYETDRQEREQMTFLELRNHLRKTSRQPNCQIVNSKLKVVIDGDGKWEIKYRLKHPPTFRARHIFVGWFDTEEEALIAYNNTAMLHDGHEATIRSFRSNPQVAGSQRNPNARWISQPVLHNHVRRSTPRNRRAPAVRTIVNQVLDISATVHVSTTKEVVSSVAHQLPSLSQLQSLKWVADLADAYALAVQVPQLQAVTLNAGDQKGGELDSSQFSSSTTSSSSTLPINIWSNRKEDSISLGSDIETLSGSKTLDQLRGEGSFSIDGLDLRLRL